eukprot:CAMPEP_0174738894 /NCGR_PEP_ID=MMETSP1094-20130205/70669_1 /TAXON_ID=156173 /ORGANISM="Chrysochromulina brevifilum, Strain UTEX LB 985" /LENGTH=101 /DNA_ID=CAMNT_0015942389 /DNA_START=420 /DNA_END=725 /DNA_ORIENTATION=-
MEANFAPTWKKDRTFSEDLRVLDPRARPGLLVSVPRARHWDRSEHPPLGLRAVLAHHPRSLAPSSLCPTELYLPAEPNNHLPPSDRPTLDPPFCISALECL